jgi:uncharacterized protein with PIN domain
MFVDASALTAMLTSEQDARELLGRLQNYAHQNGPCSLEDPFRHCWAVVGIS